MIKKMKLINSEKIKVNKIAEPFRNDIKKWCEKIYVLNTI